MSDYFRKRRGSEDDDIPIDIHSPEPEETAPGEAQTPSERTEGSAALVPAEEVARLLTEKQELTNTLVRRQADFENYRKRVERERQDEARRGASRLLQDLLPVLDGFDRALAGHPAEDEYRKGVELIQRHLWDTLSKHGLERIAAEGRKFDPHYHEAIERVETRDYPDGSILQVVREGYLFDGRVLRPSLVRVAVTPESADGDASSAEQFRVH